MGEEQRMPPDPVNKITEASTATRVMYESLREAGFSVFEACVIIGTMLGTGARDA